MAKPLFYKLHTITKKLSYNRIPIFYFFPIFSFLFFFCLIISFSAGKSLVNLFFCFLIGTIRYYIYLYIVNLDYNN